METKSLSALKSRKEEIIDHLEDLLGKEEAEKISHKAIEPVKGSSTMLSSPQQQQQQQQKHDQVASEMQSQEQSQQQLEPQQLQQNYTNLQQSNSILDSGCQSYSIWTSKSIATLSSNGRTRDPSLTPSDNGETASVSSTSSSSANAVGNESSDPPGRHTCSSDVSLPLSSSNVSADDIIPFADTPHISRFGPISRKAGTPFHSAQPSQTQAVISDEPTMTAVVRHSKQLTRQVPTMAALYHQNGKRRRAIITCTQSRC